MRTQRGAKWSSMLIERERNSRSAVTVDRSAWYMPKMDLLSPAASAHFHLSFLDPATQQFLDDSAVTHDSFCLQFYYSMASAFLSIFFSKTNINGLLNRGGMFLFSTEQLREFLQLPAEWITRDKILLDLGSGDGGVTQMLASLYDTTHVTEMSKMMQWRLQQRGFVLVDAHSWLQSPSRYSLISALNLIDRHFSPRQLLRDLHTKSLQSDCPVLLSLVLPIKPYVEFRPNGTSSLPDVSLRVTGNTLEEQVGSLIDGEFREAGFEVLRWTKLPYLCEGDFHRPYYTLDDAVFLLRPFPLPANGPPSTSDFVYHHETGHIDL